MDILDKKIAWFSLILHGFHWFYVDLRRFVRPEWPLSQIVTICRLAGIFWFRRRCTRNFLSLTQENIIFRPGGIPYAKFRAKQHFPDRDFFSLSGFFFLCSHELCYDFKTQFPRAGHVTETLEQVPDSVSELVVLRRGTQSLDLRSWRMSIIWPWIGNSTTVLSVNIH